MANRYATADDVKAYYGIMRFDQLTSDTGVDADDALIIAACNQQSSFMDGYLMGRYTTPITAPDTVIEVLKVHCVRLVMYVLFQGRLMAEQYQSILTDRDITIKWLESIASNKASIPGQVAPTVNLTTAPTVGGGMTQVFGTEEPLF